MSTIPATSSLAGSLIWLVSVGCSTFLLVYFTSDRHRIGRRATSILVSMLALGLTCAYLLWTGMNAWTLVGTHPGLSVMWGLAIGLVAGVLLSLRVHAIGRPHGLSLARSLAWDAGLFGCVEGLLLNALPALIGWQAALGIRTVTLGSLLPWVLALGASVVVVWTDHLAYPETRNPLTLIAVTLAGGGLALGFVVTGNVLTTMLGHAAIHACQIVRGGEVPPYQGWNARPGGKQEEKSKGVPA
jgi:hypothetical protein